MMQLREVRLTGDGVEDAFVTFAPGGNVIAGDSDTGKSYILRCIDFVLGAEEMTKIIDEAKPYETVLLELENSDGAFLTLERHLSGGDVTVYESRLSDKGDGRTVQWKRQGRSTAPDVTSAVFTFCGIKEAALRKNVKGEVQRLSIRTLLPVSIVDEISVQAEKSPLFGERGFDETSRKRMFSFLLTGKDDADIVAQEQREIAQAEIRAKLSFIDTLLVPLEQRLSAQSAVPEEHEISTIERVDDAITRLSSALTEDEEARVKLREDRLNAVRQQQQAETQILAVQELVKRYRLLSQRYTSDLKRLDFVAEGAHFSKDLQKTQCPLCDQPLGPKHVEHFKEETVRSVYEAAQAEAAKIHGHRAELGIALKNLEAVLTGWVAQRDDAARVLTRIDLEVSRDLRPRLRETKARLDDLIARRVELENVKSDQDQAASLQDKRAEFERALSAASGSETRKWSAIDPLALRAFCEDVETVLKGWGWSNTVRVEFDEGKAFDTRVDGKPRQSHGKGYRAILHAAFVIGLLNYCQRRSTPHTGFLVIDSPLTPFKKTEKRTEGDEIDPAVERAFWSSLVTTDPTIQIIVLENKEPPAAIASDLNYTHFAGENAETGQRVGFFPFYGASPI